MSHENCQFKNNKSENEGGVIWTISESRFERCHFEGGNYAEVFGGALCVTDDSTATITDCEFDDNAANTDDGGAICFEGDEVHLEGCRFTANSAGDWGGALVSCAKTEINICNFEDNKAFLGGALHFNHFCSAGVANIVGASFAGNSGESGGAVFAVDATVHFQGCDFDNDAADFGGAIFSECSSSSIDNCNFSENSADEGGAIFVDGQHRGQTATFENSHFVENSANDWGGAVTAVDASVDFLVCEFDKNNALVGGGVYLEGGSRTASTFKNCHFSGNDGFEEGGAMFHKDTSTIIDGCNFDGNSGFYGGAIMTINATTEIVGGAKFECNGALAGGAMLIFLAALTLLVLGLQTMTPLLAGLYWLTARIQASTILFLIKT